MGRRVERSVPEDEVELKLALAPAAIPALRRSRLLARLRSCKPVGEHLRSEYFDTPEGDLRRGGVALRIRTSALERTQTLKLASGEGPHGRIEVNERIQSDIPDLELLPRKVRPTTRVGAEWRALRRRVIDAGVGPVFASEIHRTRCVVGEGGWQIEVALDRGHLEAGGRREPVLELELELKKGVPRVLFDFALALHEEVPFRLSSVSKAERGARLAMGAEPAPTSWVRPPVEDGLAAPELLRRIGHASLAGFLANEDCFRRTEHPEAIHQMRVAIRRLRSAIRGFDPLLAPETAGRISGDLRWVAAELGELRDIDVFDEDILGPVREAFPEDPGLHLIRSRLKHQRAGALESVRCSLSTPRLTRLLLRTGAWLETLDTTGRDASSAAVPSTREFGAAVLEAEWRRVRGRLRKADSVASMTEEERHRLRITTKRLRYAAEFFGPLFPKRRRARRYLKALRRLQEELGHMNDVAVAGSILKAALGSDPTPELWRGEALVLAWHAAGRRGALQRSERAAERVTRLPRFWRV